MEWKLWLAAAVVLVVAAYLIGAFLLGSRHAEKVAAGWRTLRRDGPLGVARKVSHWRQYRRAQQRIDSEYGTETQAWVQLENLDAGGPNLEHAVVYGPSPLYDAERVLQQLPIDYGEYDFVDLGCGKGMMLILAAGFRFRRVVGVEFGRVPYDVGLANLQKYRERRSEGPPIEILLGDAADFPLPDHPLLVYLFNPFGANVIRQVLGGLEASLKAVPRDCWIVYLNPVHHDVFAERSFLTVEKAQLNRDQGEPYAVYRARGEVKAG
jgi:SAM-dependent methyltransferase